MQLNVYRSLWGIPGAENAENWDGIFKELKDLKYDGIECSLGDIAGRENLFQQLLKKHDLKFICGVYTSWQDYEGPWENKRVEEHFEQYRDQLHQAQALQAVHVNSHSGSDSWTREECEQFFSLAVEVESTLGVSVSHETHRGRALFNPFITAHLLNRFPTLWITADWSHWTVVCERLLSDNVFDEELLSRCAERVRHIHARVGSAQSAQVSDPRSAKHEQEVSWFEKWWERMMDSQWRRGQAVCTVTPEYGPPPYMMSKIDSWEPAAPLWDTVNDRAERFREQFEERARDVYCKAKSNIPIIDISAFLEENSTLAGADATKQAVAQQLRDACENVGFFYITGHGVQQELLDGMHDVARRFFALPEDEKCKIALANAPDQGRGYQKMGQNVTYGKRDWHEAIDIIRELDEDDSLRRGETLPADHPLAASFSGKNGKAFKAFLRGRNQWPDAPSDFTPTCNEYISAMLKCTHTVMRAMALSLDLPEDYFANHVVNDSYWILRVIGYPPLPSSAGAKGVGISCGQHTDYGLLTIVNQDSTQGALQVRNSQGLWMDANPIPGCLVMNIGDMFNILTNNRYRSTVHRVINNSSTFRTSIPFFLEPCIDAVIQPLPTCQSEKVDSETPTPSVVYGAHLFSKIATNFDLAEE